MFLFKKHNFSTDKYYDHGTVSHRQEYKRGLIASLLKMESSANFLKPSRLRLGRQKNNINKHIEVPGLSETYMWFVKWTGEGTTQEDWKFKGWNPGVLGLDVRDYCRQDWRTFFQSDTLPCIGCFGLCSDRHQPLHSHIRTVPICSCSRAKKKKKKKEGNKSKKNKVKQPNV